jgi:hypothetical protein
MGAPISMMSIGASGKEDCISQSSLMDLGFKRILSCSASGFHSKEAVGEPIMLSVMEDRYRREMCP